MTMKLLTELPPSLQLLVAPIVDTADAAFVVSLDCQFLAWSSRAQQLLGFLAIGRAGSLLLRRHAGPRRVRPIPVRRELPHGHRRPLWLQRTAVRGSHLHEAELFHLGAREPDRASRAARDRLRYLG
jgi:hypothetical protein